MFVRPMLFLAAVLLLTLVVPASTLSAQSPQDSRAGQQRLLVADPVDRFSFVPPAEAPANPPGGPNGPTPSTFIVTYTGFTAPAQAAFQYAVDLWATQLTSAVPIRINAQFSALGPGILGSAGPSQLRRDFAGAPVAGTWYPIGLANKLAGVDLDAAVADVDASFSSTFGFYFGTDGIVPGGQYDFVSVVLHEIGHGLGIIGSWSATPTTGSWGFGTAFPAAMDRFAVNGSSQLLISAFANNSAALRTQITSNNIFFNGPAAVAANGGTNPKLYAPSTWSGGSSMSHWDEATYPSGNLNSLMTPQIGSSEAIHNLGPITRGALVDQGWTSSTSLLFTSAPATGTAGQAFAVQPIVAVRNNAGATVAGDDTTIITLGLNSGAGTLTCSGGLSKQVVAGVATFSGCSLNNAGNYTLKANSSSILPTAVTGSVTITAPSSVASHQLSAVALGAEVAVFGRSPGGQLWYRETTAGAFGPWTSVALSVNPVSRPEAAVAGNGDLYVFYRGSANDLRYVRRVAGVWGTDVSLGGVIGGNPVAALDGGGNLIVLVKTPGGQPYYQKLANGGGSFGGWVGLDGILSSDLELTRDGAGNLLLFGLDSFGSLFTRTWSNAGQSWSGWTQLGGVLAGTPSAATLATNSWVFGLTPGGGLFFRMWNGASWGAWTNLGGVLANHTDAAASSNRLFVLGTNPPGGGWDQSTIGAAFGGWDGLGGLLGTGPEGVGVGATVYSFALTPAGGLFYRMWDGAAWGAWTNLGGVLAIVP